MKFQNCIIINFVTDARTDGQAESNIPLQLFQNLGHKSATRKTFEKTKWLKPAILVRSLQKREDCIIPFPHASATFSRCWLVLKFLSKSANLFIWVVAWGEPVILSRR